MSNEAERKVDPVLDGVDWSINHYAGKAIRDEVFEGETLEGICERYAGNPAEKALWVKGAMERLDALVDEETRYGLMEYCGGMCAGVNRREIDEAKERRKKYKSIDEFMEAEASVQRIVREGDILYQYYGPGCACSLVNKLPAGEKISATYCRCSAGFLRSYWEQVLERPVRVEVIHSTITGAKECKFAVHLVD